MPTLFSNKSMRHSSATSMPRLQPTQLRCLFTLFYLVGSRTHFSTCMHDHRHASVQLIAVLIIQSSNKFLQATYPSTPTRADRCRTRQLRGTVSTWLTTTGSSNGHMHSLGTAKNARLKRQLRHTPSRSRACLLSYSGNNGHCNATPQSQMPYLLVGRRRRPAKKTSSYR